MAALRSPAQANAAVEQHPFSIALAALDTFVRAARKALPVPMLRVRPGCVCVRGGGGG